MQNDFTLSTWVKATFWGWQLGVVLILVLSSFLGSIGIEGMQFYLGIGMGGGVGFTQWRALKRSSPVDKKWIWFSILGLGLPFIVFDLIPSGTPESKLPMCITLGGILVGLLQYGLLKNHYSKALWWIMGCFGGWTLAVLTVFAVDYTKHLHLPNLATALVNLFLIVAGGLVLGLVSGTVLKKVLNSPNPR